MQPDSIGFDGDDLTESEDECRAERSRNVVVVKVGITRIRAVAVSPARHHSIVTSASYLVHGTSACCGVSAVR